MATYFGGIEGGATHSKLIMCNGNGEIVATVTGPSTNHWVTGIPECANRIAKMVNDGKLLANIPQTLQLKSLGLSLSGCEQEATNKLLEMELKQQHIDVAENYLVCSDTIGSVFTASPLGGLVLIAGTGSNALLSNPDGKTYSCGGWGNMLADEGSAWWISHRAVKAVFDDMDNLIKAPHDTSLVWSLVQQHFNVKTREDLLEHCYTKFQKSFFAQLCEKLAKSADAGDPLCKQLFEDAGKYLAKATIALLPRVSPELAKSGDLCIVCVGSVWRSWDLLKDGFLKELSTITIPFGLQLLRLTQLMALGAVYIGVDAIKMKMPRDYTKNFEVFHHYYPSKKSTSTNGIQDTRC